MSALYVAAAGALGAVTRFEIDRLVTARAKAPLGTFVVNVTGALLLGILVGAVAEGTSRTVLGTGFLGAYTTFSTYTFEVVSLTRAGRSRVAAVYATGGVLAGVAAAAVGLAITS